MNCPIDNFGHFVKGRGVSRTLDELGLKSRVRNLIYRPNALGKLNEHSLQGDFIQQILSGNSSFVNGYPLKSVLSNPLTISGDFNGGVITREEYERMRCEDNEIIAWIACKYIFPALGFVIGILRIMMSNMYPYWSIFCWCIYTMLFLMLWHCKYRFAKCLAWLMIPFYLYASVVVFLHGLGYVSEKIASILTESAHQAAPLIFIGVVVGIICYKILSFFLKNK